MSNNLIRLPFFLLTLLPLMMAGEAQHPLLKDSTWSPLKLSCSYFNLIRSPGEYELWLTSPGDEEDRLLAYEGGNLLTLKPTRKSLSSSVVKNYDNHPTRSSPVLSRASVIRLADGRYGALAVIGPQDNGESSELIPTLFVSPNANRRSWTHLGTPLGEPKAWLDEQLRQKKLVRSEGGSLALTPEGKLRMYIHGYGTKVCMAEADHIDGSWAFFRDKNGTIVDLAKPMLAGGQWLFPHVTRLGKGYLLTGGKSFPTRQLWAAVSRDGKSFSYAGGIEAPLLRPGGVTQKEPGFKILRSMFDSKTREVILLANLWTGQGYDIYGTRVPYFKDDWFQKTKPLR